MILNVRFRFLFGNLKSSTFVKHMYTHKRFILFLFFIFIFQNSYASLPKDLVKKVLSATAAFEQYEIVFEKHFKYPKETDTLSEIYNSTICRTDIEYYVGWHKINYLRSGSARSLLASNQSGLYRVNYKENLYYKTLLKDNEKLLIQNMNSNVYKPLLYTKEDLGLFDEVKKTDAFYFLEKIDSGKDNQNRVRFISTTKVCIDRITYLPVSEEIITVSNGNTQYSLYKLISYKHLEKTAYKPILKTSDSLISIIKGYVDADSLKKTRKDQYVKLKVGDSIDLFKASLFGGGDIDMSLYKDSLVILDFYYTTCAPCIAAVPELNSLYSLYHSRGLHLFGVNGFETDWENVPLYIQDRKVLYPMIKTTKQTVYNYGVTGFPRLFVIKNGVVVKIYYGFAKGMDKELGILIEKLLQSQ